MLQPKFDFWNHLCTNLSQQNTQMGTNIPQQKIPNVAPNFRKNRKKLQNENCRKLQTSCKKLQMSCRKLQSTYVPAKSCRNPAENCTAGKLQHHISCTQHLEILQKSSNKVQHHTKPPKHCKTTQTQSKPFDSLQNISNHIKSM